MPRRRQRTRRALAAQLTSGQRMELLSTCADEPRYFESEADRARAWAEHADELLDACSRLSGRLRPAGWWAYECTPEQRPQVMRVGHVAPDRNRPGGYPVNVMESELSALLRCNRATPADMAKGAGLVADPRETLQQS